MNENIILASASPRRKELLKFIVDEFEIIVSNVEEIVPENIPLYQHPEYLAKLKALDISKANPNSIVIGADTSVFSNDKILGKPKNKNDAYNMLEELSGNVHQVITGCAVVKNGICESFSVTTDVEFYKLTDNQINEYIATNEPFDKAGAYGIQGKGSLFVKGIKGDYFNVVGLPIAELNRFINKLNLR